VALEYAYRVWQMLEGVSVFWVHASNAERFRESYASIALKCCIPGYDSPKVDVLSLVKRWLEEEGQKWWLMVIDNADDGKFFFPPQATKTTGNVNEDEYLGQYIPECSHGSILITTRNKQVGLRLTKGKPPIEVNSMDGNESEQLLRTSLGEPEVASTELSALCSRLEYLPLAMVQAASFMEANSMAVTKYLQLLENSDQDLVDLLGEEFDTTARDSETPRAVAEHGSFRSNKYKSKIC
jgi:hypothetical protein